MKKNLDEKSAGVHSIREFALMVPDLVEAERFMRGFGLELERTSDQLVVRTGGSDHIWARVFEGSGKRLQYISLGCYESDLQILRKQVRDAGGHEVEAHGHSIEGGFWFTDPEGVLVNVVPATKTMPDRKMLMTDLNVTSNVRGACARSEARMVKPTRLAHLAVFTSDVSRSIEFYTSALGLRLSDRSGDIVAFLHGRYGSDHHLLAFIDGGGGGLHHSSWDVPSIEDIGLAKSRILAAGYPRHWGVGRHVLGSNYFNYVKDAFGLWWEHSAHIDYIDQGVVWDSADYPADDALYLWGPDMPEEFPENTERSSE